MEDIKTLGILSEKTRKDIDIFLINSHISDDKEKIKRFYDLIQRVIVESCYGSKEKITK